MGAPLHKCKHALPCGRARQKPWGLALPRGRPTPKLWCQAPKLNPTYARSIFNMAIPCMRSVESHNLQNLKLYFWMQGSSVASTWSFTTQMQACSTKASPLVQAFLRHGEKQSCTTYPSFLETWGEAKLHHLSKLGFFDTQREAMLHHLSRLV